MDLDDHITNQITYQSDEKTELDMVLDGLGLGMVPLI